MGSTLILVKIKYINPWAYMDYEQNTHNNLYIHIMQYKKVFENKQTHTQTVKQNVLDTFSAV